MLETLKSLGIYRKRYADTFMTFYLNIDVLSLTRARHKTKKEKKKHNRREYYVIGFWRAYIYEIYSFNSQ